MMLLRDFLRYEYCPLDAGNQAAHARDRRLHRLDGDHMRCLGEPCGACRCPVEQHLAVPGLDLEPFLYCQTYGCDCEGFVQDEQQTG
jgi:hypothetical protein